MNAGLTDLFGDGPEMAWVRNLSIPTPDGHDLGIRVLTPTDSPHDVIVYYHGGGWVIGDMDGFDTLARQIAERAGSTVLLVDYRLAPEHLYPTAANDAWTVLQWADEHRESLAGAGARLVVAGDSSGGNLAAVVAQRAAREGGPRIAAQVLVYPVCDADFDTASYSAPENQLMLDSKAMYWFWDLYTPEVSARASWDAAPLRAESLSGLPPAVVLLAEYDVLRDEGEKYAAALEAAGVAVHQHTVPGQMHGFFTFPNVLPGAKVGLEFVVDALERALALSASPAS